MYQVASKTEHGLFNHHYDLNKEEKKYLLNNYSRFPVNFVSGKGVYLYDDKGKEYLDFLCGIAVTSFGHCHPAINKSAEEQINKFWHISNLFDSYGQNLLAKKLYERSGLEYTFFCNSGTEANEAAIKFARKWGNGKFQIIAALGGFHGRTYGSLSATGQFNLWQGFYPLAPGFIHVPFGDIEAIENNFNKNIVAVMLEPIQGEKGIIMPEPGYLKAVKDFCDKKEILLILDEVQTGIGRTGKFFAHAYEDIQPDILTIAKGIANGISLGATLCSKRVADIIKPGDHGSTFGGNPIAIAAANKVVDLIDEILLRRINYFGDKIRNQILSLNINQINEVRGRGLMIGLELNDNLSAKTFAKKCLERGLIVGTSGDKVLRILPPFIIEEKHVQKFLSILVDIFRELN